MTGAAALFAGPVNPARQAALLFGTGFERWASSPGDDVDEPGSTFVIPAEAGIRKSGRVQCVPPEVG